MKGRYGKVLVDFWSGQIKEPDTLNIAIRLLALPLPFYQSEEEAVDLIESYIDNLPDQSFSDRLSAGNRAEVSRIVRNTVRQVDPELSTEKLTKTVSAWKRRGFDPTDKTTWNKGLSAVLARDFCWKGAEVMKLGTIQKILNCSLDKASAAMKYLLRLVKSHKGEIAVSYVKSLLERFGISCGHHGKVNSVLALLRQWDWIRVTAWERWYERDANGVARNGRARAYCVGGAMVHKFEDRSGSLYSQTAENNKNLSFTSHRFGTVSFIQHNNRLLDIENLLERVFHTVPTVETEIPCNARGP